MEINITYNYIAGHFNSRQFFTFKMKSKKIILIHHFNKNCNILQFKVFPKTQEMDELLGDWISDPEKTLCYP